MPIPLSTIEERIQLLSNNLNAEAQKLDNHIDDCEIETDEIEAQQQLLHNEDVRLHQEIHDVSNKVDTNSARLDIIEQKDYQGQIDTINSVLTTGTHSLQKQLIEMDVEHHEEMHHLAQNIDVNSNNIRGLELEQAQIPDIVVLTVEEYEAIAVPDPTKLYYIYEAEL